MMLEHGEYFFEWAIQEMVEGKNEMDEDLYLHAIRNLRKTAGFTKDEREEMSAVFQKFDTRGIGSVECPNLGKVLHYMGYFPTDEILEKLIREVDADGGGEIDEQEFFNACRIYGSLQLESWRKVFDEYDDSGTGNMSTTDMHDCVKQLGWYPTRESIKEAVELVDFDQSGTVSFDEFFKMMQHLRITEGFTNAEAENFKEMFNRYDIDGSGE